MPNSQKLGLDAVDIRILNVVQQYGQLSKTKLAEKVNLSPTPAWLRLTRLINLGFIRGYNADIAIERIVDFSQVYVTVSLSHHRKVDFDRFEAHVKSCDEITECYATGGGMDYVMRIYCPDLATFQAFMESLLDLEIGIDRYLTYFVTRKIKEAKPNLLKLQSKS